MTSPTRAELQRYYATLFPVDFVLAFLAHTVDGAGNEPWSLSAREITLTLPKIQRDDTFKSRFNSASTPEEWRSLFVRNETLLQIDVGGVFYTSPAKANELRRETLLAEVVDRRELTFDIDLTDYDEFRRRCCADSDASGGGGSRGTGKKCCRRCWPLAVAAATFLEALLRDALGVRQLVWFYSGRRGLHCWVCDERCARLPTASRGALVEFIAGERVRVRNGAPPLACVARAAERLSAQFALFARDQALFTDRLQFDACVADLCMPPFLADRWRASPHATLDALRGICALQSASGEPSVKKWHETRRHLDTEVLLRYMYPRLDRAVTADRSHLIKMPFSLHPVTGNVCMPLPLDQMRDFDPAPTVVGGAVSAGGGGGGDGALHVTNCTPEKIERCVEAVRRMLQMQPQSQTSTTNERGGR